MERVPASFVAYMARLERFFRKNRMFRAAQQTLIITFPFLLFGSFVLVIQGAVFNSHGFIAEIYNLDKVIPYFKNVDDYLQALIDVSLNLIGIVIATFAAKYVARSYHKDDDLAALCGAGVFLLLNYDFNFKSDNYFYLRGLGIRGVFLAMVVGLTVGWLFHVFRAKPVVHTGKAERPLSVLLERAFGSLPAMGLILLLATIISFGISLIDQNGGISVYFYRLVRMPNPQSHQVRSLFLITALNNILWWLGISGPLSTTTFHTTSVASSDNLNYALTTKNLSNVPHPYIAQTLIDPFALFGGTGCTLALTVAILLVGRSRTRIGISRATLIPQIFNVNYPFMAGIPVVFNPIMFIPFVLAPIANMLIAFVFIWLRWMPPVVYQVPDYTPSFLVAFLGTNGNWVALLVTIICFIVSILIYLPFVYAITLIEGGDENEATY